MRRGQTELGVLLLPLAVLFLVFVSMAAGVFVVSNAAQSKTITAANIQDNTRRHYLLTSFLRAPVMHDGVAYSVAEVIGASTEFSPDLVQIAAQQIIGECMKDTSWSLQVLNGLDIVEKYTVESRHPLNNCPRSTSQVVVPGLNPLIYQSVALSTCDGVLWC